MSLNANRKMAVKDGFVMIADTRRLLKMSTRQIKLQKKTTSIFKEISKEFKAQANSCVSFVKSKTLRIIRKNFLMAK